MKKRMSRSEHIEELVRTDDNFRRLYEKVLELNGGRIPSPKEIDRQIQDWRARHPSS